MTAVARIAALSAVLGLVCLWWLDASAHQTQVPPLVRVGEPAATRLIVLFVDSLSERDVGAGAMPNLAARLTQSGLHGPVEPCADAITVPCMTAAITGDDHLSVFALATNFASGSSAVERSVLGQLQGAGRRVGYLGERILAKTMAGLTYVRADLRSDEQVLEQLPRTLERERLDLLIVHLSGIDQAAHKYGEAAPEYGAARSLMDAQLEEVIATQLEASDHVLVMGDHGHTSSGRHAAGLDVTTYAAYFGPQFARRVDTPMVMTEHAAVWARLFGFSRAAPGWLDDYFAGRALRPRAAADGSPSSHLTLWTLLGCVLLACAACAPSVAGTSRERYTVLLSFCASLALMAGLGAVWPDLRGFIWDSRARVQLARIASLIAAALFAQLFLGWVRAPGRDEPNTWPARYAQILTAALVFALPTVYPLGGPSVVQSWLLLGLLAYALWFAVRRDAGRATQLALSCLLLLSVLPVKLANYVPRGFTIYTRLLPSLSPYALPLVASALLLFIFLSGRLLMRDEPPSWLAVAIGASAVACTGTVSDRWFALPCCLALPLGWLALRAPRFSPLAVACAIPAVWFFYGGALGTLTPILVIWSLCVLLPRVLRGQAPALRGALFLSLVLLSFRAAMGCRIAGIDFDFFFRFLPPEADVTAHWVPAALLTTAKYVHTVTLSILLVRAQDADLVAALREAVAIARARLGVCLFFLAGLMARPAAGAAIVGDASQEAAIWVISLGMLALVALTWKASACQARAEA